MSDAEWKLFFSICAQILGDGGMGIAAQNNTWCSWTTFGRLKIDAGYWQAGLPECADLLESGIGDGGVWGQPFTYGDLAHIVVPREFYWERISQGQFDCGTRQQDIEVLSKELSRQGISHRKSDLILEIKLY